MTPSALQLGAPRLRFDDRRALADACRGAASTSCSPGTTTTTSASLRFQGIRSFVVGTGGRSLYPVFRRLTRPRSVVVNWRSYGVLRLTLRAGRARLAASFRRGVERRRLRLRTLPPVAAWQSPHSSSTSPKARVGPQFGCFDVTQRVPDRKLTAGHWNSGTSSPAASTRSGSAATSSCSGSSASSRTSRRRWWRPFFRCTWSSASG